MKTKPVSLIIGLTLLCLDLMAGIPSDITFRDAVLAANKHLAKHEKQNVVFLREAREIRKDDLMLAYVFDLAPAGYLVVGASTGLPPIVAYSFESNFGSMEGDNPLFTLLKADLSKRWALSTTPGNLMAERYAGPWEELLSDVPGAKAGPRFEQWPATGDGWLKTNWTQSAPYNDFCPMDLVTGLRSIAGCPATAMAQIMNFHKSTNNTRFGDADDYYHNYAGRQYWIDDDCDEIDFPCFTELNTYLDTLDAHYKANGEPTVDDKAAMTFACGTAARQVYTSQGSGTFSVSQAYEAYLRFGCSTVTLLDSTDADLFERLKQNIIDTLPTHLAVVDESWSTGHNVVVDGYNTDDFYHLNFGWGGAYNGWYLLPQEIPYELTVIEGVVVDIMKKIPTGIPAGEAALIPVLFAPNPVHDKGLLTYTLNESSDVSISVHDLSGKQIMEFRYMDQPPGLYNIPLSLEALPGGMYFYSIQSGKNQTTGKIIRMGK